MEVWHRNLPHRVVAMLSLLLEASLTRVEQAPRGQLDRVVHQGCAGRVAPGGVLRAAEGSPPRLAPDFSRQPSGVCSLSVGSVRGEFHPARGGWMMVPREWGRVVTYLEAESENSSYLDT